MVAKSGNAAFNSLFFPMYMIDLLVVDNRTFVPGSMVATWQSFLVILRYCLSGTRFLFRILSGLWDYFLGFDIWDPDSFGLPIHQEI